jgi:hypothetical protein
MNRVILQSPYATPDPIRMATNMRYARAAMLDSVGRGESPFMAHLLFSQVLDDMAVGQREQAFDLAFSWYASADSVAVYTDLGISEGMERGIGHAKSLGLKVDERTVPDWK